MHDAICPSCGVVNHLADSDLGVRLNCGSCGEPFVYGAEIARQRKAADREAKRAERERIKNERAAEKQAARDADQERRRQQQTALATMADNSYSSQAEESMPTQVVATPAQLPQPYRGDPKRQYGRNGIICPNVNCGFVGKAAKRDTGSLLGGLLILLICIVLGGLCVPIVGMIMGLFVGLVLAALGSGKSILICPNCGVQIRET